MGECKISKKYHLNFCVIIISLLASPVFGEEISLSSRVDKTDIPFEGSVNLALEVKWQGDITSYSFEIFPLPETENLKVVGTSSAISSGEEDGREITTRTFKYTLEPTEPGIGTIEPIVLRYISWPDSIPGELSTQGFKILIADPLPPSEESQFHVSVLIVVFAAGLIAAILIVVVRKRRAGTAEPEKSSEKAFLDELEVVKKESHGDRKLFFTQFYKLLSAYLESKYELALGGKTTQVILEELERLEVPIDRREKITGWLALAEKEKFAPGGGTPGDIIRLINEVESFLQKINVGNSPEVK